MFLVGENGMENMEKLLNKILENQERFEKGQKSMQSEISGMKGEISDMKSEMTGMQGEMSDMKNEMTRFKVLQEKMQGDIELLSEGHKNIIEIMDRGFNEIRKDFNDRLDEVEAAVTNLGEDVKFIKHKEFQNEESIFKLKESLKIAK